MRIVSQPGEEEDLGLMVEMPEISMKILQTDYKCTRHIIHLSCMQFHIEDKLTKGKLVIEA